MGLTRLEKEKLAKQKCVKKEYSKALWGQILLAIPKHLLKLTILAVVGSFIGMIALINSDKSLADFLGSNSETYLDFSQTKNVHPLMIHMQD